MSILYEGAREFGLELTRVQLEHFERYYQQLIEWNKKINLTTITEYTEVEVRHFLDSLSVLRALPRADLDGKKLIDIGTGAGLPGMPLAIALPHLQVTLLDATRKKVLFMDQVMRELGLENVTTRHARAEELGRDPAYREGYDFATARAVAELRILAEYALPFVRVGGHFIAQKSIDVDAEIAAAANALELLGGAPPEQIPIQLPGVTETRYLVVIEKRSPTPAAYPRRVGQPEKKPL